jgi:glucose-6-phosphate isomerase
MLHVTPGKIEKQYLAALKRGLRKNLAPEIMRRNAGVFSKNPDLKKLIANRLGWVDVASKMNWRVREIEAFGNAAIKDGLRHVVICGMGGSSLCPEVFGKVFGRHPKIKTYQIIDSTDPAALKAVLRKIELKRTLFIVASKSGGTVETRSQEAFFIEELKKVGVKKFGGNFAAITDKGSQLEKNARKRKYRKVFINPSDIGGRYSALSFFGLVPGFFAGIDVGLLLAYAISMEGQLRTREDESNPGIQLGAFIAGAALAGVDKMTLVGSGRISALSPWIEQLVAESTGKQKKGVVPVEGEALGRIADHGPDRFFVTMATERGKPTMSESFKQRLTAKKHPIVDIMLDNIYEIGFQLLLWEVATAVAGALMNINPFDEPNVTESKKITNNILEGFTKSGVHFGMEPHAKSGVLSLLAASGPNKFTQAEMEDLSKLLRRFFIGGRPPRYLAVLNYFKADGSVEKALTSLRSKVRSKTGMAVLRGYGPRYLHSIGQLYKGGPKNGLFIFLVRSAYPALEVPGEKYHFGHLIEAQAIGDAKALIKRKLPTLVISIEGNPARGIQALERAVSRTIK